MKFCLFLCTGFLDWNFKWILYCQSDNCFLGELFMIFVFIPLQCNAELKYTYSIFWKVELLDATMILLNVWVFVSVLDVSFGCSHDSDLSGFWECLGCNIWDLWDMSWACFLILFKSYELGNSLDIYHTSIVFLTS